MKRTLALSAIALLALAACGDDAKDNPPQEDASVVEGDEFLPIERSEAGPGAGTDGVDPSTPFSSGARVGRFRGGEPIITGPEARCRPGDFILQNPHITACITDGAPADQMQFTAGRIVDLVPTDDPTGDTLDFIGPGLGLLEASTDELAILRDGSDGGPAILRATGVDLPLKLLVGSLGSIQLTPPILVRVETEFRLAPDAEYLEIVTWVNLEGQRAPNLLLGDLAFPGDLNVIYTWPKGVGSPGANAEMDAVAFVGQTRSYGLVGGALTTPPLDPSLLSDSIFAVVSLRGKLGSEYEAASRRYVTVGDGTTASLRKRFGALFPTEERVTVAVESTFPTGFTGGRWAISRADGTAVDIVRVDPETTALDLPPGELHAELIDAPQGVSLAFDFTVPSGSPVVFPAPDVVPVTARCFLDGAAEPAPACRVEVIGTPSFIAFQRATEPLLLPRGFSGTLRLSHAETYTYEEHPVADLQSSATVDGALSRLVDTSGWAAGDMHQHAMRSADSTVPSEARVLANLAAGLDFFAPTDHDIVEDYPRVLEEMGLAEAIHLFQGAEISPVRGHINIFPVSYTHGHASGAPALAVREGLRSTRQRNTNELLAEARDQGAQITQINHARSETSSLFDWVKLDPVTGQAQRNHADMPEQFESMEIFNAPKAVCALLRDWFSFHRRGIHITGVGNSDTHALGAPSGWPRNYVHLQGEPLTDDTLVKGLREGRVTVSGGLIVDFGDELLPGDVVDLPADAGSFELPIRIRSTEWTKADELIVFVNGHEVERIDLRELTEPGDTLDFDEIVTIPVERDAFVVVFAYSDTTMNVVTPGKRAFGFVNPVFLDVGGDGWTAPGVSSLADVPLPVGIPFCPAEASSGRSLPFDPVEALALDPWSMLDHL